MICEHPYQKGVLELGCGRCHPCRVNRARLWVGRMMLESYEHEFNCFTTLTYADQIGPLWLNKRHVQLFLKRLREKLPQQEIRYYAVGEYGDQNWRPHYHLILFGVSLLQQTVIQQCWPWGFTFTGTAEAKSMSYCSQYVVKKLNNPKDRRLRGRPPEFQMMSLNPGLGQKVVARMVTAYKRFPMLNPLEANEHRVLGQRFPLGRYIKDKFYDAMGVTKEQRKEAVRLACTRKFLEIGEQGITNYQRQRAARVKAAIGRRIERMRSL